MILSRVTPASVPGMYGHYSGGVANWTDQLIHHHPTCGRGRFPWQLDSLPALHSSSLQAAVSVTVARGIVGKGPRMSIIGWLIIGALAGWIASKIMKTDAQMGWAQNIIVGIVGALVGGFLWGILSGSEWTSSFDIGTLLVAIVGAVIVLWLWNFLRRRK